MRSDETLIRKVTDHLAVMAGWGLVGLCFFITLSALLRKLLNISLQGADEYGGYLLAIVCAFGFSYALLERAHIRISVLRDKLGRRTRAFLDLLAIMSLAIFAYALASAAFDVALTSGQMGARASSPLRTLLVVPQGLWALGLTLFALLCLHMTVRALLAMLSGQWQRVESRLGTKDVNEEVAEELSALQSRTTSIGGARP